MSTEFEVDQVLGFESHPTSRVVGIDPYVFQAVDGIQRQWNSYTLVPKKPEERKGIYERWYAVNLPVVGLSFVQKIEPHLLPFEREIVKYLTGSANMTTFGDGSGGTGITLLASWVAAGQDPTKISEEAPMFAREIFLNEPVDKTGHHPEMHFKTTPMRGPVAVLA